MGAKSVKECSNSAVKDSEEEINFENNKNETVNFLDLSSRGGAEFPDDPDEIPATISKANTMQHTALQIELALTQMENSAKLLHRSPSQEKIYLDSKKNQKINYEEWWHRVYVNEFGVATKTLLSGKIGIAEKPADDDWRLSENPYPYDWPAGYLHYCFWSPTRKTPEDVAGKVLDRFSDYSFVIWEDPLKTKSIPEIWHVQIVLKPESRLHKQGLRLYIDGSGKMFQKPTDDPLTFEEYQAKYSASLEVDMISHASDILELDRECLSTIRGTNSPFTPKSLNSDLENLSGWSQVNVDDGVFE